LILWVTVIVSLITLFGFLWINSHASWTYGGGANIDLERFVRRPSEVFVFLFVVFISLAFSYIMNNYVVTSEVANAWQLLAYKWKKGKFQCLDNNEILNVLKYKE